MAKASVKTCSKEGKNKKQFISLIKSLSRKINHDVSISLLPVPLSVLLESVRDTCWWLE